MDRGTSQATAHRVAESDMTEVTEYTTHTHTHTHTRSLHKWNHTLLVLLCLDDFIQHYVFKVDP